MLNEPAGQGTGTSEPATQKNPSGQIVQFSVPDEFAKDPTGHTAHVAAPGPVKVPGKHRSHVDAPPAAADPPAHWLGVEANWEHDDPTGHALHAELLLCA